MEYKIEIEGLKFPVKLIHNSYTGKLALIYGNKSTARRELILDIENEDGTVTHLRMKRQLGNMIPPKLFVDEIEREYTEKLTIVDKIFLAAPILLPLLFALTGMVFAFILFFVNHNIIYHEKNKFVRAILCLIVTAFMAIITMYVASYLYTVFNP